MTEIPVNSVYPPGAPPAAPPEPGDWHGMFGMMTAHLGKIAGGLSSERAARRAESDNVWSVIIDPVPIPLAGNFGVLDLPQLLGPGLGEYWDVHIISSTGYTAGSVQAFINLPGAGLSSASLLQAAMRYNMAAAGLGFQTYGKNHCPLRPQDRLTFVASGVTVPAGGQILVSLTATRVAEPYWGRYLV